jgi:hypothetical protein
MALNEMMNRFRLADRELFNHFFHVSGATGQSSGAPPDAPAADGGEAWDLEVRFSHVEPGSLREASRRARTADSRAVRQPPAGDTVELNSDFCPIMLNREVNSGYWDFPIREVTRDARLLFLRFFDRDILAYRDGRYVLAQVDYWPSHPEAVGKQALIETQYVHFVHAPSRREETTG